MEDSLREHLNLSSSTSRIMRTIDERIDDTKI